MSNNNSLIEKLSNLGLKDIEAEMYIRLLAIGVLTARELANELNILTNNVYRSANALIGKKLIVKLDTRPKKYQAIQPTVAIGELTNQRLTDTKSISAQVVNELIKFSDDSQQTMRILTGQKALLEIYAQCAKQAQQEILVISVGEPVSEQVWITTKLAISKGLKPKFIFHKNDKENYFLIKKWLNIGVEVRHQPLIGYHLYIFDSTTAVLSASNPTQSEERTGVVMQNEAIVEALRTYFFQQWEQSKPL